MGLGDSPVIESELLRLLKALTALAEIATRYLANRL